MSLPTFSQKKGAVANPAVGKTYLLEGEAGLIGKVNAGLPSYLSFVNACDGIKMPIRG